MSQKSSMHVGRELPPIRLGRRFSSSQDEVPTDIPASTVQAARTSWAAGVQLPRATHPGTSRAFRDVFKSHPE